MERSDMEWMRRCALGGLAVVSAAAASVAGPTVVVEKIVLRGEAAPGTINSYGSLDSGGILEDGSAIFWGNANPVGLWTGVPGSAPVPVALGGQQAPGAVPGVTWNSFDGHVGVAGGQTAFLSAVQGPGVSSSNDRGIWTTGPSGDFLLAREGSQAGDLPAGVSYDRVDFGFYSVMNAQGTTAFGATLTGTGVSSSNNFIVQTGNASGVVTTLAREGDAAPGTAMVFSNIEAPVISDTGSLAFRANLDSSSTTSIYRGAPGAIQPVVVEGDAAPGTGGLIFNDGPFNNQSMAYVSINANDAVTFPALLQDTGTGDITRSVWRDTLGGGLEVVAKQGDIAPGTEVDTEFFAFFRSVLNDSDEVVFTANLTGPQVTGATGSGMWKGTPGSAELLVRSGDQVPGQAPGVTFSNASDFRPLLNDAGQVVFQDGFNGGGQGILAWDPVHGVIPLIATGDVIEVEPGDFRTVSGVGYQETVTGVGSGDGRWYSLNDNGQLTAIVNFQDGSGGVFRITIPSPPAALVLGILPAALLRRRRR